MHAQLLRFEIYLKMILWKEVGGVHSIVTEVMWFRLTQKTFINFYNKSRLCFKIITISFFSTKLTFKTVNIQTQAECKGT